MSWPEWFEQGLPQRLAVECSSREELAERMSEETGKYVSVGALKGAHRRLRDRFDLPDWTDLFAEKTWPGTPPVAEESVEETERPQRLHPEQSEFKQPERHDPLHSPTPRKITTRPGARHLFIPDTQDKPGAPNYHFDWIGALIADVKPDALIHAGDHWDMPSLSSYDKGKRSSHNRFYADDIAAGNESLDRLDRAMRGFQPQVKVMLRGNHEYRIERYANDNPEMSGKVGYHDLADTRFGWEPIPFLETVEIDGIRYCHYFPRGANGLVMNGKRGQPNARLQLQREQISCTAGHKQGLNYHPQPVGNRVRHGLIAGSCYLHDEGYLTPQGNNHWRGVVVKHCVNDGEYDIELVSLHRLRGMYG